MEETFSRTKFLIGEENFLKLSNKNVVVFGVGGVGGYVVEALIRSGISNITIVDNDVVSQSNLNRQIIALNSTIGKYKVDVMKERILDINPNVNIETSKTFFMPETKNEIDFKQYDYIVDAIDSVKGKLTIVECANEFNIPIISSMGTGNKLNPTMFEITDINKTSVCPLARVMRVELRKRGIKKLNVLYSKEIPVKNKDIKVPASIAFCPSVAGLIIASFVVKELIEK